MRVEAFLTVASAARRVGIAPATLRTWDRRYGLGPTHHEAGQHRRYSASDVAKLMTMRRLIMTGVAPREAARQALVFRGEINLVSLVEEIRIREELVDALYRAALALDTTFVEKAIRTEIAASGVANAWHEVIAPLFLMVGEVWAQTGKGIEVELLLTEIVKRILWGIEVKNPLNPRPVLLAAVGDEPHSLAIYALSAALAEREIQTLFLGAGTPFEVLTLVVKRLAPPAIFFWAQMPQHGDPKFFRDIPAVRPAPRVILGGPGWVNVDIGAMPYAEDLRIACEKISQAVGVESPR